MLRTLSPIRDDVPQKVTKEEKRAYSLLGIFDVNTPILSLFRARPCLVPRKVVVFDGVPDQSNLDV